MRNTKGTNLHYPDTNLSASRDRSLIPLNLTRDEANYGMPYMILNGHGHFVSDMVLYSDGQFALSASWDNTLRLWDLVEYVGKIYITLSHSKGFLFSWIAKICLLSAELANEVNSQ